MPFDIHQSGEALNPGAAGDVIFVHGLTGDHTLTWLNENGFDWIRELRAELPEFNILSVNYHSTLRHNPTDLSLVRIAETLTTTLLLGGVGKRPIVFVCHSLGGLITKAILRRSAQFADQKVSIARNCIGTVFLAVPHRGSKLADYLTSLPLFSGSKVVQELVTNHDWVDDLNKWFRIYATTSKVEGVYFYETRPMLGSYVVVPMSSADPEIDGFLGQATECDHVNIAKPTGKSDTTYYLIRQFIESVVNTQRPQKQRHVLCHFLDHHVLELAGYRRGIVPLNVLLALKSVFRIALVCSDRVVIAGSSAFESQLAQELIHNHIQYFQNQIFIVGKANSLLEYVETAKVWFPDEPERQSAYDHVEHLSLATFIPRFRSATTDLLNRFKNLDPRQVLQLADESVMQEIKKKWPNLPTKMRGLAMIPDYVIRYGLEMESEGALKSQLSFLINSIYFSGIARETGTVLLNDLPIVISLKTDGAVRSATFDIFRRSLGQAGLLSQIEEITTADLAELYWSIEMRSLRDSIWKVINGRGSDAPSR